MRKSLRKRYLGLVSVCLLLAGLGKADEMSKEYDPKRGFTPAQRSLTTTLLKLAGSLEHHGSPEPYIRWVLKENARVDAKYAKAFGGNSTSRPDYLTDEYAENLLAEWKKLEKPLKLQDLCRESGKHVRFAIRGSWNKSPAELAAEEDKLTPAQRRQYAKLLQQPFFRKKSFPALDAFYADGGGYDKLSEEGKKRMSDRVFLGTAAPEIRAKILREEKKKYAGGTFIVDIFNEYQQRRVAALKDPKLKVNSDVLELMLVKKLRLREVVNDLEKQEWNEKDAIWHSHMVREIFRSRFRAVDAKLSKAGAESIKGVMNSMAENLLVIAHLEFMAGLSEKMTADELAKR